MMIKHTALTTDVSSEAIGAVLHQHTGEVTEPLSFFSVKLNPPPKKYSTFSREPLPIYTTMKHFCYLLEGHNFTIFTDHKLLIYALHAKSDKYNPRDYRQLEYISLFTMDI